MIGNHSYTWPRSKKGELQEFISENEIIYTGCNSMSICLGSVKI